MKLGFIGCGNMAGAMIGGILEKKLAGGGDIIASVTSREKARLLEKRLGIKMVLSNEEVIRGAEIVFLAVKPQVMEGVLEEIRDSLGQEQILISMAPGKKLAWLENLLGNDRKLVRIMPNTPALVGEGMTALCPGAGIGGRELETIESILHCFGRAVRVKEELMDTVTAVSGSSPAYIFMVIEAMADGAVAGGMTRKDAYEFAAQAVLGSAKMVLETGLHPGELKDMVCSPGGTTIEAVRVLEGGGLRSTIMEAMEACLKKSRDM